ncbi:SRF-type transcription factor RlmA [Aspergillus undulatus]|uniref:SRF-type transcription factor RlmA n=1 Tax=Aspergillus undulatus TaxID=1810928 RepID=UPI003CCDF0F6
MGRRKIEIKAIKDDRNRSVTFLKRKGGLFKKAHELAVLCSVDVAVIIFGHNKKLYEFSSCDMQEALYRHQYIGPPHEHKGPEDFNGKREDDDDDEEDATPAPEDHAQPQNHPHMMAVPHPGFQHVNHAPSASPPIHNGIPFDPRHGTPQPQGASRPSSRNHLRRVSSNLSVPPHHGTPPPPHSNNFSYMANASVYNPNAPHGMNQQHPRPPQFAHFGHHPQAPHHQPPPQHQPMPPHSVPPQSMTPQPIPQHPQVHPQHHPQHHPHVLAQPPSTMAMSQPPHPPIPHVAQPYLADQQQPPQRPTSLPEASSDHMPATLKTEKAQSPPLVKPLSNAKSRSIFTPIDDHGSVLANNFLRFSESMSVKPEPTSSEIEEKKPPKTLSPPPRAKTEAPLPKPVSEIKPPARTNSGQFGSKRPQLKVQIPSESSDRGSATAESSSSAGQKAATPVKGNMILPPPSPSAGAIHSAGAQGPPNPFARPPPPGTAAAAAAAAQNNNAYNNSNNIETTPISALPSRFVSDALLPSPSSFFPAEWGFGRSGPDSNILPSPLVFPTPQVQNGPGFGRDEEQDKKRKSPDSGPGGEATAKKAKT